MRIAAPFFSLTNDNICTSPAGGMPLFNIVWLYSHFFVSFFPVVREDSRVFLFLQTYPTLRIICNDEVFGRTEPARAYWMGEGTFLSHPLFLTARHPKIIPP